MRREMVDTYPPFSRKIRYLALIPWESTIQALVWASMVWEKSRLYRRIPNDSKARICGWFRSEIRAENGRFPYPLSSPKPEQPRHRRPALE